MENYDLIYVIKDNNSSKEICETAVNQGIDGSLVSVIIRGNNIKIENTDFGENVSVYIDDSSDGILFENCMFEGNSVRVRNMGTRVLFYKCTFKGGETFVESNGFDVFYKSYFICSSKESILVSGNEPEELLGRLIYTVIMDSEIVFKNNESMAYVTDRDMKVTLINTKIKGNDSNTVIWTREMVNENTFSYYNCDYIFGSHECGYEIPQRGISAFNIWNMLSGNDGWDPLMTGCNYNNYKKEVFYVTARKNISFTAESEKKEVEVTFYPNGASTEYTCNTDDFLNVTEKSGEYNRVYLEVSGTNDSEEAVYGFITIISENGLKAECVAEIKPSIIEPPKFLSTPVITIRDGKAYINYDIDLNGREDMSEISWYRVDNIDRTKLVAIREFKRSNEKDCRKIAVSRSGPCREIALTPFDVGKHLKVNIKPKHSRSNQGAGLNVKSRIVMASDIKSKNIVINLKNQVLNPYYKAEPGYGTPMGIWFYEKLKGCRHWGMVTESSECGYYINGEEKHDNMTVYVILDMENNGGEGFNRKGEYQEIYIKYDSNEKCGYGIRCECVDAGRHLGGFSLYKYDGITAKPISAMITGPYMKSGMDIKLDIINNSFGAEITVPGVNEIIEIKANIEGNEYSGMGIRNNLVSLENNRISVRYIEINYPENFPAD